MKCGLGGRRPPGKLQTMARKLRWECEGGLYHVFNRGNYRRDVFGTEGATHSFEEALIEIVGRQRWKLHGYVIMRNTSRWKRPSQTLDRESTGYSAASPHASTDSAPSRGTSFKVGTRRSRSRISKPSHGSLTTFT